MAPLDRSRAVDYHRNVSEIPVSHSETPLRVASVSKALLLVERLADAGTPLSLTGLTAATGLPRSTVFRLVITLLERGWLAEVDGGYWLGLTVLRVGAIAEDQLDVRTVALEPLRTLLAETNETVHLGVLDGFLQVVYLEKLQSTSQPVGLMGSKRGLTAPSHCTGIGKMLLASVPLDDLVRYFYDRGLERFTDHTIVDLDRLRSTLEQIRQQGFAYDDEEHEMNVRCVAAPVVDRRGQVVAAVSVAGPADRMSRTNAIEHHRIKLLETAATISGLLGYVTRSSPETHFSGNAF